MAKQTSRLLVFLSALPGAGIVALGLGLDAILRTRDGFGTDQLVIVIAGLAVMVIAVLAARRVPRKTARKMAFAGIMALGTVVLAEVVCSTVVAIVNPPLDSFWIFEESGRTFQFDPIRGYRLTTVPSRVARVTYGEVEYIGVYQGNEQGFPDQDDFTVEKPDDVERRYLVFGDSFTAAQFIHRNWPDYIEHKMDGRWQLYNFSTDGAGLANWWSNFVHIVEEEGYEYDGVIFAVFAGDLRRSFSVAEHRGFDRHMFGRVPSWVPEEFPTTDAQARKYLRPSGGYILGAQQFAMAVRDKQLRPSRSGLEHLWLTGRGLGLIRTMMLPAEDAPRGALSEEQRALIEDIGGRLKSRQIRPIVVHIPARSEVIGGADVTAWKADAREFAKLLGAQFVDGSEAFADVGPLVTRNEWFPHDGHWAQGGSNRFGRYFMTVLEDDPLPAANKGGLGDESKD